MVLSGRVRVFDSFPYSFSCSLIVLSDLRHSISLSTNPTPRFGLLCCVFVLTIGVVRRHVPLIFSPTPNWSWHYVQANDGVRFAPFTRLST